MADVATVISSTRLGWQLLAKVPWLTGWLLRHFFPIDKCKSQFSVDMPGAHVRFELLPARPSFALAGLEVRVHNLLPFAVEFSVFRLTSGIDSFIYLDAVLNTTCLIPATGVARMPLPEIVLTDQQANWVRNLQREYTRVQLNLHWRCTSAIHDWEAQGSYDCTAYVNKVPASG